MNLNFKQVRNGFTLIELVLTIAIIGIAVTGTLLTFTTTARTSADPLIRQQALSIAKSYLEEVLAKEFPTAVPCGASPGGGRGVYSNVCHYDGLTDTGAADQTGTPITGLESYNVSVTVETGSASLGSLTSGTEVVRVDVVVNHPTMQAMTLSGYRANY